MLRAVVDETTYGGLDAALQALYVRRDDGTYLLQIEAAGGFELADAAGLKSALSKERTAKEAALQETKTLAERFGDLDPAAAREALTKVADMANWDPEKKLAEARTQMETQLSEKFETDRVALTTKHEGEMTRANTRTDALQTQLTAEMITARGRVACQEEGGNPLFLLPHIESKTRMREVDEKFVVEVLDSAGNARISTVTGATTPMTLSELVVEMKADKAFAPAFDASGKSGGGSAPPGGGAPAGAATVRRGDLEAVSANIEGIAKGTVKVVD